MSLCRPAIPGHCIYVYLVFDMRVGVDIIEKKRWSGIRHCERFLEFVLTAAEQQAIQSRPLYWGFGASRLAAKEAIIKALPVPTTYHDFAVIDDPAGGVLFVPLRADLARYQVAVSLAHSDDVVISYALCT